ncbi:MAG: hypothetical protein JNN30_15665 [Rhodanobacteraceae bacterium]|nr:hypothetical protein [Rhodanobacteraceae bacterium]
MKTATHLLSWCVASGLLLCLGLAQAGEETAVSSRTVAAEIGRNEFKIREQALDDRLLRNNDVTYARNLMAAAAREREINSRLMAGTKLGDIDPGELWSNLGPSRMSAGPMDSGRVTAIVTHPDNPDIVYVASGGGGVWRSNNAGDAWVALTDKLGSLGTGALAMDPNQPNRLYLGLGDPNRHGWQKTLGTSPGLGVLKSTDGGANWSAPIFLGDSTNIRKIVVSPNNSNLILVATDQGLYRSTNAGGSYQLQPLDNEIANSDGKPAVWSIAWAGGNRFVVSTEGQGASEHRSVVWHSNEQATGWERADGIPEDVGRISIGSAPSSPNVQYALMHKDGSAQIYKTIDGGQHWSSLNFDQKKYTNFPDHAASGLLGDQADARYNQMVVVNPTAPSIAYFGGKLELARTGDGGMTFSLVNTRNKSAANYVHPDFHAAAYDAANRLYVGNDGGVFRSSDAGQTWMPRNEGLVTHLVYGVASSMADLRKIVVAMQDNGIWHSFNTGAHYTSVDGGDGFWALMSQTDSRKIVYGTNNLKRYSDDGGVTHNELTFSGIPGGFARSIVQSAAVASGETLYAVSEGKIYKSVDFGKNWQPVNMNGLADDVSAVRVGRNSGVLVALSGSNPGNIWFTLNDGAQWTQAAAPNNPAGDFIDAAVGGDNQFYLISGGHQPGKRRIWTSNDPAKGWFLFGGAGLPEGVRLNVLKADPARNGTIYLGTDLGMYRSTNKGLSFSRLGAGLPLVSIADIWLARDGSKVRVGTYGRGVWSMGLAD